MNRNMLWMFLVLVLLAATPSHADSYLAVVANGDDAVNLYRAPGLAMPLVKSIPVGKQPTEICPDPNRKRIFVSVVGEKKVAVIALDSQSVVGNMSDPGINVPDGCAVSPDSKKLYLLDKKANTVFVFSTASNQMIKQIPVGEEPRRALFSPDGRKLLISCGDGNSISVIDPSTDTVVKTIRSGHDPRTMTFTPDGKWLVVGLVDDDCLEFFKADTWEFDQQVGVPRSPQRVIVAPDGQFIYVLGSVEGVIALSDLRPQGGRRVVSTIPIGHRSYGMAMSAGGKYLYTSSSGDNSVSVMDLQVMKIITTFPAGKSPGAMLFIQ